MKNRDSVGNGGLDSGDRSPGASKETGTAVGDGGKGWRGLVSEVEGLTREYSSEPALPAPSASRGACQRAREPESRKKEESCKIYMPQKVGKIFVKKNHQEYTHLEKFTG